MSEKTRVTYPREVRQAAKDRGAGLVTISVTFPDGTREEYQGWANAAGCQYARWAAAGLFCVEARPALPELEQIVRKVAGE